MAYIGSIYPGDEYNVYLTFPVDITLDSFEGSIEQSGLVLPMTPSVEIVGSKIKFNIQEEDTVDLMPGEADVVFKWTSNNVKRTLPKQILEIK